MKSLFRFPRYGLTEPCFWSAALGGIALSSSVIVILAFQGNAPTPAFAYWVLPAGVLLLTISLLAWQEIRAAVTTGIVVFAILTLMRVVGLMLLDFQWKQLLYTAGFAWVTYLWWQARSAMRDADLAIPAGGSDAPDDGGGDIISLVLLQRKAKYLEEQILARMIQSAWGGNYLEPQPNASEGDFVVGESPVFMVGSARGMYLVHNHAQPYTDDLDAMLEDIGELRLRDAVAQHTAWLSADKLGSVDDEQIEAAVSDSSQPGALPDRRAGMEAIYAPILKLILELADEDTLAVFCPQTGQAKVWSEELLLNLQSGGGLTELFQMDNAPVIPIEDDDPRMLAAIEQAQAGWPEFVAAFESHRGDTGSYIIKAGITHGETTEFIWAELLGFENEYIHAALANDPIDLGDLKLGSQVEFLPDDIIDWGYTQDNEPIGLFTTQAIGEIQAEESGK